MTRSTSLHPSKVWYLESCQLGLIEQHIQFHLLALNITSLNVLAQFVVERRRVGDVLKEGARGIVSYLKASCSHGIYPLEGHAAAPCEVVALTKSPPHDPKAISRLSRRLGK